MVKELEDAPRDEVVVLLDGDASASAGEPFEIAVRAAGSILRTHVRRGRRCALVVNSATRPVQTVASEGDWHRAFELLATVEADGRTPVHALLQSEGGIAARSLELVVVTSRVDGALADRLVQRALSRRGAALVFIGETKEPQLLRLQAAGIAVAVVRPGGDLAEQLAPQEARVA
jgi:Mg-chelatase subunit ChlD